MNYEKLYNNIIEKGVSRGWSKKDNSKENPIEIHHIIPESMGGSNDPSNLVGLTIREHFIAHIALAKWKGGLYWRAAYGMIFNKKRKRVNSRLMEKIVIENRQFLSESMKGNTRGAVVWSQERKAKHKEAMQKVGLTPAKQEALKLAKISNTGRVQSPEEKKKRSDTMKRIGIVPTLAGTFYLASMGGKANKGVKKKSRSPEHTKNQVAAMKKRYDEGSLIVHNSKSVTIDNVEYESLLKASKATGYSLNAIRKMLVDPNYKPKVKPIIDGIQYKTYKDACKATGLTIAVIKKLMIDPDYKPYYGKEITINNKSYPSISHAARDTGFCSDTIRKMVADPSYKPTIYKSRVKLC